MTIATINNIKVPKDVMLCIFSSLNCTDLARCARVSRGFRGLALDTRFLTSRFPKIVLQEGQTIQKWLLEVVHSQEQLLRIIKNYFNRIPNGQVAALTVRSRMGASVEIRLGYNVESAYHDVKPDVQAAIQVDSDVLKRIFPDYSIESNDTIIVNPFKRAKYGVIIRNSLGKEDLMKNIHSIMRQVIAKKSLINAVAQVFKRK